MTQIKKILTPGTGIDIVQNLNSAKPVCRSSLVLESNHEKNIVIAAQTSPPMLASHVNADNIFITAIVKKDTGDKHRLGIKCKINSFIRDYELSNKKVMEAIQITCIPPFKEINIRSAFRVTPSDRYQVLCKIVFEKNEYIAGREFKILDISATGIGLLFPKKKKETAKLILKMQPKTKAVAGLVFKDKTEESPKVELVTCGLEVARINLKYSEEYSFIGMKFSNFTKSGEDSIYRFVHNAQMYDIQQINRLI